MSANTAGGCRETSAAGWDPMLGQAGSRPLTRQAGREGCRAREWRWDLCVMDDADQIFRSRRTQKSHGIGERPFARRKLPATRGRRSLTTDTTRTDQPLISDTASLDSTLLALLNIPYANKPLLPLCALLLSSAMSSAIGKWLHHAKQIRLPACFVRPQRPFTLVTGNESCGTTNPFPPSY